MSSFELDAMNHHESKKVSGAESVSGASLTLTRRQLFKAAGITGGGLILGFSLGGCSDDSSALPGIPGVLAQDGYLQLTANDEYTVYIAREEMGQGTATGLSTLLAEELDVDLQVFDIKFTGSHKDYINPELSVQATGGSNSLSSHFLPMRQVGANARAKILQAAAEQLAVPANTLSTENGHVLAEGKRIPYGVFADKANSVSLTEDAPLKPADQFKLIGKAFTRVDAVAKSTGTAEFGIDVEIPDMYYVVVKRCPVIYGTPKQFDASQVKAMSGVTDVVAITHGVAVVAEKFWQAKKAVDALEVEWDYPEHRSLSNSEIHKDLAVALDQKGVSKDLQGDVEQGFDEADIVIEERYQVPYLSHSPLEPMNAVLRFEEGKADLWTGSQAPPIAQALVANKLGIGRDQVTVHGVYIGGSFGRRGDHTHVEEVAEVVAATGKTLKLLWSREDDIRGGHYRPASHVAIKAGVSKDGKILAWSGKRSGGSIAPEVLKAFANGLTPEFMPDSTPSFIAGMAGKILDTFALDTMSVEGLAEDYDYTNTQLSHVMVDHGLPLLYWRSVGHTYTAFAKEAIVDELAEKVEQDPLDFRLANLADNPRMKNVVQTLKTTLAQRPLEEGLFRGVAAHHSFKTDVAQAADISIERGRIRVHKVTCVIDCGLAVNPDIVRAQMEGGIVYGLTAALYGKLDVEQGAVKQSNFHDYPLLRMNESPDIEVIIVDSQASPTGVGEPGVPPIAPAVANAVYAATGKRLRALPFDLG